jgi:signal transduction histidine kinase
MSEKQGSVAMPGPEAEFSPYYDNLRHCLHELAQPLATVTGLVDLLLLELDERDKIFQEVQLISQQLEKVMQIIGEIRQMTREAAEREKSTLKASQVPLS